MSSWSYTLNPRKHINDRKVSDILGHKTRSVVFADEVMSHSDPIDELVFDVCFTRARARLIEGFTKTSVFDD